MNEHKVDIVKYRFLWFGISLAILIPGIIGIVICCLKFHAPLKPGIDFTGGSILQYQFDKAPALDTVRHILDSTGFAGSQVQQAYISGREVIIMRTKAIENEAEKRKLDWELNQQLGPFKILSVDKVSATVGPELLGSGLIALFITFLMMIAYISFRFKFDYAVCAIIALLHDVIALCGIFALLGIIIGTEVDSLFISAILTVIGFSVHDTIVVFDRIRENAKYVGSRITDPRTQKERKSSGGGEGTEETGSRVSKRGEEPCAVNEVDARRLQGTQQPERLQKERLPKDLKKSFGDIANDSVNQTLARSIYTSLTVIITLFSLYLLGGVTTRDFVLAMLIGIISGTYSSIFNASCLLVLWREIKAERKFKPA